MKRREFIKLLGGAAAAWPVATWAQNTSPPVIGFLGGASAAGYRDLLIGFRESLSVQGFVDGQNVRIEYRWSENQDDQLPALAAELLRLQPSVIVVVGTTAAIVAAKSMTTKIPIVFYTGSDPVARGFVSSLAHPGGNITGFTILIVETVQKRLEILCELVPTTDSIAVLVNKDNPNIDTYSRDAAVAAQALGRRIEIISVGHESELEAAFATLAQQHTGALAVSGAPVFRDHRDHVVALAARHAIPTVYAYREFVTAGGLMSYGSNRRDSFYQIGSYAARILKGENPADLPVQRATKVELVINLKTSKVLGLTVPQSLLGRADEVIE